MTAHFYGQFVPTYILLPLLMSTQSQGKRP